MVIVGGCTCNIAQIRHVSTTATIVVTSSGQTETQSQSKKKISELPIGKSDFRGNSLIFPIRISQFLSSNYKWNFVAILNNLTKATMNANKSYYKYLQRRNLQRVSVADTVLVSLSIGMTCLYDPLPWCFDVICLHVIHILSYYYYHYYHLTPLPKMFL